MQIYYKGQNIARKLVNRTLAKLHKLKLNITFQKKGRPKIFFNFHLNPKQ